MTGHDASSLPDSSTRLDSWKEIAAFLGRSVRTVKRWEQTLGLPVRRLPGGQRHSVFAYSHEIDAWLKRTPAAEVEPRVTQEVLPAVDAARPRARTVWYVLGGLTAVVTALTLVSARSARSSEGPVSVSTDDKGVTVAIGDRRAWTWPYPRLAGAGIPAFERDLGPRAAVTRLANGRWEVTAVTPTAELVATHAWIGSDLVRLASDGRERWRLTPSDTFVFDNKTFGKPWQLTHWTIEPQGDQRLATAWRDMVWWPSVLKIIGADARVQSTFVNPGWLLSTAWVRRDGRSLVVAAGISNAADAGIMGVVDPDLGDAAAPLPDRREFACENCASGRPLLYAVFPRSEINIVSGSPFNTAGVTQQPGQILIRTLEVPDPQTGAEGVYQFSETFDLKHASFGDRYWEIHRRLEAEGKLTHSRAACPDRNGPREVRIWTPREGWRTVKPS